MFATLSDNIIAGRPTLAGLAEGLRQGAARVNAGRSRVPSLNMARDWASALDPAALRVAEIFKALSQSGNTGALGERA